MSIDARTERPEIRYSLWATVFINGKVRSIMLADNLDARNIDRGALREEYAVYGRLTLRRDDSTYEDIL